MPNTYESPQSIERRAAPPPRPWLRSAFFKLNFPFALLFALSCFSNISLSYENVFLAALAAGAILIYAACEGAGIFNRSVALERGLGLANLIFALVVTVFFVVNLANPPPNQAPDSFVFVLVLAPVCVGFVAYLVTCGILRLKWTAKSNRTLGS